MVSTQYNAKSFGVEAPWLNGVFLSHLKGSIRMLVPAYILNRRSDDGQSGLGAIAEDQETSICLSQPTSLLAIPR